MRKWRTLREKTLLTLYQNKESYLVRDQANGPRIKTLSPIIHSTWRHQSIIQDQAS